MVGEMAAGGKNFKNPNSTGEKTYLFHYLNRNIAYRMGQGFTFFKIRYMASGKRKKEKRRKLH